MHMFLYVLACISTVAMTLYFHEECFYVVVKGGDDWIHLGRGGDGGGSLNACVLHRFGPTVQLQWGTWIDTL